jgi:long-chain acyl-CoA synthetase
VVGGAALDPALSRVFIGLGLAMLQGYGMTEASPVISVNRVDDNDPASVGAALPGIEVGTLPSGELLVRGANVMLGYWRNEPATQAALDADGWLHSGDLAEIRTRSTSSSRQGCWAQRRNCCRDVELAILRLRVRAGDAGWQQSVSRRRTRLLVRRANEQLKGFPRWIRAPRARHTAPWSVDTGLLTPTLKLRRPQVLAQFRERIDAAYAGTTGE